MVRIARRGKIAIYVYPEEGQPHDRPHCHIYSPDAETVVALEPVEILAGRVPSAAAFTLFLEHLSVIKEAWNRLNPRRPV